MLTALKNFLEQARRENWCNKYGCTTCGASVFREALAKLRVDLAQSQDRIQQKRALVINLRRLSDKFILEGGEDRKSDIGLIIYELGMNPYVLIRELEGTPVGRINQEFVESRRASYRFKVNMHQEIEQEAEAARARKSERRRAHAEQSRQHKLHVDKVRDDSSHLTDSEFLIALTQNDFDVPIDLFKERIKNIDIEVVRCLAKDHRQKLLKIIDKRRGDPWNRIKKALNS